MTRNELSRGQLLVLVAVGGAAIALTVALAIDAWFNS